MGSKYGERTYTLLEAAADAGNNGVNNDSGEEFIAGDEDGEGMVASVEDQLRKEMTVYEVAVVLFSLSLSFPFFSLGGYLYKLV